MVSSYSSDLKLEIQVTGENAGTWGDITNTNLIILQQAIAGYESVALNATTGATLTFTNGLPSNGKNAVLEFTGTITGNVDVTIPSDATGPDEKVYIIKPNTSNIFSNEKFIVDLLSNKSFKRVIPSSNDILKQSNCSHISFVSKG